MIIGLHGKAGAGKDAFADRFVDRHGFVKRGFASALYEEVAAAFGVTVEWLGDRCRKELPQPELRLYFCQDKAFSDLMAGDFWAPRSPRWVLQHWGTEYRRAQDDNYWIKRFGVFCKAAYETGAAGVVAPDMRFENEAQFIRAARGKIIEIYRPGLFPVEGNHVSAKRLPDALIDHTVFNSGSLMDLYRDADVLARPTARVLV